MLGTVAGPSHEPRGLLHLSPAKPLRFRFMVHAEGDPKLLAFVDGVKSADDAGALGESLVDIEPADLQGQLWKLEMPTDDALDKPVLLVERQMFNTAQVAANNPSIAALVMPEVMRQIARCAANQPAAMTDTNHWLSRWDEFFKQLGIEPPSEDFDAGEQEEWATSVVIAFCAKPAIKLQVNRLMIELNGGAAA